MVSFVKDGVPLEEHKSLNEISWGNREGQRITPEEDAYYHRILRQWQEGNTSIPVEGGESPEDVALRQRSFLDLLKSRSEDKTVLICMHGRAMRILLCQLLQYPLQSMDKFEHENLGLYLLHYTGTEYTIELYNDTGHLTKLRAAHEAALIASKK